jgi:hypothetical protein
MLSKTTIHHVRKNNPPRKENKSEQSNNPQHQILRPRKAWTQSNSIAVDEKVDQMELSRANCRGTRAKSKTVCGKEILTRQEIMSTWKEGRKQPVALRW